MSHIIAICGTMGSGKSTAVAHLREVLSNVIAFYEDDFNPAPLRSIDEVQDWWERGGQVEEFDLSALVNQLQDAAQHRKGIVLLETQFGRMHPGLRPLIDLQCWIDVAPDIALARKVAQLARQFSDDSTPRSSIAALQWIAGFCESYYQTTRKLFVQQRANVARQSDVQVSGDGSPDDVCRRILQALPGVFEGAA